MFLPMGWVYKRPGGFRSLILVCASLSLFAVSVIAQSGGGMDTMGTNGKHTIRGRIYFPSGRSADFSPRVRLESTHSGDLSVLADAKGEFVFAGLSPGNYMVVVEGGNEFETARESVYIDSEARTPRASMPSVPRIYSVLVYLQPKAELRAATRKTGVVDASMAAVPAQARTLYEQGVDAARKGNSQRAVDLLTAALQQYPQFPQALTQLGVEYLKLGQTERAEQALHKAVTLAPNTFTSVLNYGIALLNKKDFQGAVTQLRAALHLKESAPTAHMYLAIALINLHNYDEAEKQLLRAIEVGGENLGLVHYYLGGIYWEKRDYQRAADSLEKYLKLEPQAPDAARVLATIKELRNKSRGQD